MAGDWVKMRTDLYRDPKVCMIADSMMSNDGSLARYVNQNLQCDMAVTRNVMRNAIVGSLVTVWGVLRHRGSRVEDDLIVYGAKVAILDDMAEMPGIGESMADVGWVTETAEGLLFRHFFEEYNVEPERKEALSNAERQRRFREKKRQSETVTKSNESNDREEKRREEKSTKTNTKDSTPASPRFCPEKIDLPPLLDSADFRAAWCEWCKHRSEIRKPLKPTMCQQQLKAMEAMGTQRAIAMIRHTVAKGWTGLREPEQPSTSNGKSDGDFLGGVREFMRMNGISEEEMR